MAKDREPENYDGNTDNTVPGSPSPASKKAEKTVKADKPKKKRGCGGCGCFLIGLLIVLIILGTGIGVGAYFGNKFLTENYGVSLGDCFSLLHNIYNVNEGKVVTDPAKEKDKTEFYTDLGDATFIKGDEIDGVVDTAVDEEIVPRVNKALDGSTQESATGARKALPLLESEDGSESGSEESGFDWKQYLFDLLEKGAFDTDRIKAYFDDEKTIDEKYDDYFMLTIKGKGIVSTVEHVINRTLEKMDGMKPFKNTFGLKQLDFKSADIDENTESRTIRAVLQLKLRGVADAFFSSSLFDKYVKDANIRSNKEVIRVLTGLLPKNLLVTFNVTITNDKTTDEKTLDVAIDLNNLSFKSLSKWFDFAKRVSGGTDIREVLNENATKIYAQMEDMVKDYIDVYASLGDGKLSLDVYGAGAAVLNKTLELEGEQKLTKYEAASAVTDVLYANSDVNGNGIDKVMTTEAPYFLGENWKSETENDFLAMLRHSIAFRSDMTFDDFLNEFKDESGKMQMPAKYAPLLDYLDEKYLKTSLAFLEESITLDDRYVAYLFEDYKADMLATMDFEKYADAITLNYTKITTADKADGKHAYASLGITAHTLKLLEVMGYADFRFLTTVFGEDVYVCAKADVTLDPSVTRDRTTFILNGLSADQTAELVSTASKIAKKDIIGEFIEKYIDEFVTKFDKFKEAYFDVTFSTRGSGGDEVGALIFPSTTEMLQKFYDNKIKKDGKDLDMAALIKAAGSVLSSSPSEEDFSKYIASSNALLKGAPDAYGDYDALVKSELYDKYFITDKTIPISDLIDDIYTATTDGDSALDAVKTYVHVKAPYFAQFDSLSKTNPRLDGHSFAYVLGESMEPLIEKFGSDNAEIADLYDYITVVDAAFDDGIMSVTVAADTERLLEKYAKDSLGDYYDFMVRLLATDREGAKKDINVTLKINVSGMGDDVDVVIYELDDTDMQAIFDSLSAFGIKYFDFSDPDNALVKMANQIKDLVNQFGELTDLDGEQILSMTSLFKILGENITYTDAGENKALTDQEAYTLVKNMVVYDADTSSCDRSAEARTEFDSKTRAYYYINDGTTTIKGIVKDGNSDDTLTFVPREEIAATKLYGTGFIYGERNLAGLIDILDLNGADPSYEIRSITVYDDDMIYVNAVVERGEYVELDTFDGFDEIDVDMATKFLVSIPLNFGSAADERKSDMHFKDEEETKRIIKLFAIDIDGQINTQKTKLTDALADKLDKYSMSFVKGATDENTGLSMPSLTTLIASTRTGVTEAQAKDLFDDVVCYEVTESDYGFVSDLGPVKARFVEFLKEYYFVRDEYSSTDSHNGETVTFDMIADALGFHSTRTYQMENLMDSGRIYAAALYAYYTETLGKTEAETETIMAGMAFTPAQIASAKDDSVKASTRVVFDEDILLALFRSSSDGEDVNAKDVTIAEDDVVQIKGSYEIEASHLTGVSANFAALLPEAFIADIVIDTAVPANNELSLDGPDTPDGKIPTSKLCSALGAFGSTITQSDFDSYLTNAADGMDTFVDNMRGSTTEAKFVVSYAFEGDNKAGLLVPSAVDYAIENGIITMP